MVTRSGLGRKFVAVALPAPTITDHVPSFLPLQQASRSKQAASLFLQPYFHGDITREEGQFADAGFQTRTGPWSLTLLRVQIEYVGLT